MPIRDQLQTNLINEKYYMLSIAVPLELKQLPEGRITSVATVTLLYVFVGFFYK